jgi:hypothetical protein
VISGFLNLLAALELLLLVVEAVSPRCKRFLPLGQSHIAQIGILLGGSMAVYEIVHAISAFATGG